MEKNYFAIFGAGKWGKDALVKYGRENVLYFIDNKKLGNVVEGVKVVGLDYYKVDKVKPKIIIATVYWWDIVYQLKQNDLDYWIIYMPEFKSYFPEDILVYNQYKYRKECVIEQEYGQLSIDQNRDLLIESRVRELSNDIPLFSNIQIETYNRCNGVCDFCPVSVQWESRVEKKMEWSLFYKIINELSELNYSGQLSLYSNNEPFLDDRILDMHEYARKKVPKARMYLFTNGTLLTLEKFKRLMNYLDELIIDNYNQQLRLIPNSIKIKEYCESHPELIKKVTISIRKPKEMLANRGSEVPNRKEEISYENYTCVNPFVQMIVRPDGKVSLCCNDSLGKNTMGDLNINSLEEIWYGEMFGKARKAIKNGRQNWPICKYCDVFNLG